ncbi:MULTISPECIES: ribosome hibernation-promoting factor, HPF/YfiA family [Corallincola]|uniref:Ribosome-associated translation inhibitor RaiA n=3 Tax=Corallincola TaxID=1775176 RepID=A0A368NIG8_9GAMM|nr:MULTISPECIES: ribosome-associated translation inhibitor RaiA [Corallincola]RCU49219.1 ribosome-associated translation inhibitor RaiA [Corallincola holothuriorum]TAA47481.1 ribosome-associated translation inhibitor RaiA [Corallincola spongiicola]TCI05160.1 ribosome-associated translation inhibitor RaiA [Corallincola luteus]
MRIEITAKHIEITEALRERIESRFDKLERLDISLINPHVILSQEKKLHQIEASITVPNDKIFAKAEHEDMYAAINLLGQRLERQLNRYQHKPSAHRGSRSGKDQCRQGLIAGEPLVEEALYDEPYFEESVDDVENAA